MVSEMAFFLVTYFPGTSCTSITHFYMFAEGEGGGPKEEMNYEEVKRKIISGGNG